MGGAIGTPSWSIFRTSVVNTTIFSDTGLCMLMVFFTFTWAYWNLSIAAAVGCSCRGVCGNRVECAFSLWWLVSESGQCFDFRVSIFVFGSFREWGSIEGKVGIFGSSCFVRCKLFIFRIGVFNAGSFYENLYRAE